MCSTERALSEGLFLSIGYASDEPLCLLAPFHNEFTSESIFTCPLFHCYHPPMAGESSEKIKALIEEYIKMPRDELVPEHTELIEMGDNNTSKHPKHPHGDMKVHITRMAVKHVVEERSGDLLKNHSLEDALPIIQLAMAEVPDVVANFDRYEYEPAGEKHFFVKHYAAAASLVVLCDMEDSGLQVKSVHFRKKKKER